MHTGFRPLLERFNTGTPSATAIGSVLRELGVPEATAGRSAALLIEMATECGLIVEGRFKPAAIEAALAATPAAEEPKSTPRRRGTAALKMPDAVETPRITPSSATSRVAPGQVVSGPAITINIAFNLDGSTSPEDLAAVVRAVVDAVK
jgi:hypothetical protein